MVKKEIFEKKKKKKKIKKKKKKNWEKYVNKDIWPTIYYVSEQLNNNLSSHKKVVSQVIFDRSLLVLYHPGLSNYLFGTPKTQKLKFGCSCTTHFRPVLYSVPPQNYRKHAIFGLNIDYYCFYV